jgi:hypothetical protein
MNHIRKFLSYQSKKNATKVVNESVLQVDDTYKVRVIVDVKKSFVNSYIKKVTDNTQKNLRDFYSDMDIVEELVKNVVETGMNVDQIPATLLVGGSQNKVQGQGQAQPAQAAQVQTEPAQGFEEVQGGQAQMSSQGQGEAQVPDQGQAQMQSQGQPAQVPAQGQAQMPEEEEEEEEPGEEEELPR